MTDSSLPDDNASLSVFDYWKESLATWTEFNMRAGALVMKQLNSAATNPGMDEAETETLTAEILRTMSDFNLRHWTNTARALEQTPSWFSAPSLLNSAAITDWFDRVRRDRLAALEDMSTGSSTQSEAAEVPTMVAPSVLPAPQGKPDDLTKIKGIGPKLSTRLNELGIYHFDQIAAWDQPQAEWIEDQLAFKGRVTRENWVTQARKFVGNGASTLH